MEYWEYWSHPAYLEMKIHGIQGFNAARYSVLWFDLEQTDFYAPWKGKLIIKWPGLERSWWRWGGRYRILVHAIRERSALASDMPPWDNPVFMWDQLKVLPSTWRAALCEWRGIYFIFDETDGRGYVGSAYGSDNILGRWLNYAASRHGGNKMLRHCEPGKFRFSVLQRVSPDMEPAEVIQLEATWKERLHTREFGLNEN